MYIDLLVKTKEDISIENYRKNDQSKNHIATFSNDETSDVDSWRSPLLACVASGV